MDTVWNRWTAGLALLAGTLAFALAPAPALAQPDAAARKVFDEAQQAAKRGPQDIDLAGQATLHLPAGRMYVPQPHATRVLNAMGNPGQDERLQGLVFPEGDGSWFTTIRFEASGYIKDDDAKDWNADELLQSYREGTEAANEERQKLGAPGLEIVGWAEKPLYDATSHRLVWAMSSREKGAPADQPQGVNFNTYALGREGYFSLNLVTELRDLPNHKPYAQDLLSALDYSEGKRYQDFSSSTDKVAEYGLAALVVGVGAKKLGLIAVVVAFVAKFAKIFLLVGLAFGGAFMRFFKRKKPGGPGT